MAGLRLLGFLAKPKLNLWIKCCECEKMTASPECGTGYSVL